MSWVPSLPQSSSRDPEPTSSADPFNREASYRERWEIRAAQWRALVLARQAFGPQAVVRLSTLPGRGSFHGVFEIDVPFTTLGSHERGEVMFLSWLDSDPLLAETSYLYVFGALER